MDNVTKLTASNFLMWSRQVSALLDGYDLSGFLDGSAVPPPPTITNEGEVTSNPDYLLWKRQDRLIYSGLLGAITVSIQPFLSTATTSAQIWETLSSTYIKPSRDHIQQLRQQIKSWTKGTMSIDDYFQGFKTQFDQVALLGKPYDIEDQIEFLLEGLPEDYKPVKDQIEGRESPPSLTEIHEKLLNHETKLLSKTTTAAVLPVTANVAHHRGSSNNHPNAQKTSYGQSRNNNSRPHQTWQQQQFSPRNDQSSRGYQGRCQLCGVHGHSARRCNQLQSAAASYNPSSKASSSAWQPRANMAMAQSYNPGNWILDSGATHYLTTDLSNLALHQPYTGGEDVMIADGSGLPISHTGSTTLTTPSHSFNLNNILYVPNLK